jgi:tetratricopeptide (TPR) repeat protein
MTDQSRSSLTSFVSGDLTPATLYLAMVNQAVKEQKRFGVAEIIQASREKITDRPGATPFEIQTVAEMCMSFPANLKDSRFDRETIVAAEEAERLFRRLGDQSGIDRSVAEKDRLRARIDQSGVPDLSALGGPAAPGSGRMNELSIEIEGLLARQEFERAMEPVAEHSDLARESGDKRAILASLDYQAKVLGATGDPGRAAELMAEQKTLLAEIQDPEMTVKAELNNGLNLLQAGQFDQARAILESVAKISRERGYASVEGSALWGLGGIACSVGTDLASALGFFEDSVAAFKKVMDGRGMAKSMAFQAQVLTQLGRTAEALTIIGRAHQLASTLQMTQEIEALIAPVKAYVEAEAQRAGIVAGRPAASPGAGGPTAGGTPTLEQARNAWAAAQYEYMKALAEWKSLPLLKRLKTPKPQPPQL